MGTTYSILRFVRIVIPFFFSLFFLSQLANVVNSADALALASLQLYEGKNVGALLARSCKRYTAVT